MPRITSLVVALSLFAGFSLAQAAERVDVFKSRYCGCCEKWVEHMRKAGFDVVTKDVNDVPAARKLAGMPERLAPAIPPRSTSMLWKDMYPQLTWSAC